MEKRYRNLCGTCLLAGAALMVATMIFHPAGGSPQHILKIRSIVMITHALAILSMPFTVFGFWGLSSVLTTRDRMSMLAFVFAAFGLLAAMISAAINGLTLPMFLHDIPYANIDREAVRVVVRYGINFNHAMDYILIASLSISIFIWSIVIIRTHNSSWIGYYGLVVILVILAYVIHSEDMTGLSAFRIVVLLVVSWIVITGIRLLLMERIENKNN